MCVKFTYTHDMPDTHTFDGWLADNMGNYLLVTCMTLIHPFESLPCGLCVFPILSGFCWVHMDEREVFLVIFITV